MKTHDGCERAFYITNESWYYQHTPTDEIIYEIFIGMYDPDGGTSGEFCIRWKDVAGEQAPYLHAFDDSWSALQQFSDLLSYMAEVDDECISPSILIEKMMELGIKDRTKRKIEHEKSSRKSK